MNNEHRTMNKRLILFSLAVVLGYLPAGPLGHSLAYAEVPHLIRYQGQAVDSNGVPLEGPYDLTFRLYDAQAAGNILWEERQNGIALSGGHFSVLLGQVTSLVGFDWSQPRWLSIQVNNEPELAPRQQITSVPLAIRAETAEGLSSGAAVSARVYNTAAISIANNAVTILSFDSERWDTDDFHTSPNTYRLTAPESGYYYIFAHVFWEPNTSGMRDIALRWNGSKVLARHNSLAVAHPYGTEQSVGTCFYLNAGDYVHVDVFQNSGGALSVVVNPNYYSSPEFGMVKLY